MGLLAKAWVGTAAKSSNNTGHWMSQKRKCLAGLFKCALLTLLLLCSVRDLYAQPGTTINLTSIKPAEFAKKLLRSEKTGYGPLGKFQQLMQNTFTRFNYLYNANERLKEIMDQAITAYSEDYNQLLSYYPYDSKRLATNPFLDSVIQHATAGILLHDLRNQYVDELYFLLGKAYYYQQKYDTAHEVFQYLNYAFAPKDDGYDLPIGSNISKVKDQFTILNPEHKGISKNSYARKERRNDGLIWQVKNYIQSGDYVQAGVLLGYVEKDSLLPKRLVPLVAETHGFLFYRLKAYDSAASYLVKTDFDGYKRSVRPRMYYLTGQLYALGRDSVEAARWFAKAKNSALDPLLSIYSALAEASMQPQQQPVALMPDARQSHTALLEKLSRKEKFHRYKDVIYYAEGAIQIAQNHTQEAETLLLSSLAAGKKITPPNDWQKSRTYFALANLAYQDNRFFEASGFYDSVSSGDLTTSRERQDLQERMGPLNQVAQQLDSVYFQDSLQKLAGLPQNDRMQILKEKARDIRKTIARKQSEAEGNQINPAIRKPPSTTPTTLFPQSQGSAAIWYFNNLTLKNSGYQLFKQKFGNRPNVDNWQRLSAINGTARAPGKSGTSSDLLSGLNPDGSLKLDSSNIQAEDLLKDLPLTAEALRLSNQKIATALFMAGQTLQNTMENFTGALYVYDSLNRRFPAWDSTDLLLYNKYICWLLLGKKEQADKTLGQLAAGYPRSSWLQKIKAQDSLLSPVKETSLQNQATYAYNEVYQLFVAGDFAKADSLKQIADKKYGRFYWTPQLLYIEAIYDIDRQKDSLATQKLGYLIQHFSSSPIKPQAQHLLNILKRRGEIEAYLRQLVITPAGQLQNSRLARLEAAAAQLADQRERRIGLLRNQKILNLTDSTAQKAEQLAGAVSNQHGLIGIKAPDSLKVAKGDSLQVAATSIPALATNKPAGADSTKVAINQGIPPVEQPPVKDSSVQVNNLPPTHPDNTDTSLVAEKPAPEKILPAAPKTETAPAAKGEQTIGGFTFNPAAPQYVTVILHKVAPVFASEATNAFNRYNLLAFEHEKWPVDHLQTIEQTDMVQIGPFKDYASAQSYLKQIQEVAASTFLSWLTPDKYEYIIISPQNTNKLKSPEDLRNYQAAYRQFEAK